MLAAADATCCGAAGAGCDKSRSGGSASTVAAAGTTAGTAAAEIGATGPVARPGKITGPGASSVVCNPSIVFEACGAATGAGRFQSATFELAGLENSGL